MARAAIMGMHGDGAGMADVTILVEKYARAIGRPGE
jgi:hypothetical protein